jgi:hypothetical protein
VAKELPGKEMLVVLAQVLQPLRLVVVVGVVQELLVWVTTARIILMAPVVGLVLHQLYLELLPYMLVVVVAGVITPLLRSACLVLVVVELEVPDRVYI